MSAPAPVACPGRDGGAWHLTSAALAGLAAAALTAWVFGAVLSNFGSVPAMPGSVWPAGMASMHVWGALLVGALVGMACVRRQPRLVRVLAWDGQAWRWAGRSGRAHVAVDLLDWMLVRFKPDEGAVVWMPLSEAGVGAAWPAIRAALYWPVPSAGVQVFRDQPAGPVS